MVREGRTLSRWRHSDEVLATFLAMAGREAIKLAAAEDAIAELLVAVRQFGGRDPGDLVE